MKSTKSIEKYHQRTVSMPNFARDAIMSLFLEATFNGVIERDVLSPQGKTVLSLKSLFAQHKLSEDAKEHILFYIVNSSTQYEYKIPKLEEAIKYFISNGASGKYLMIAPITDFRTLKILIDTDEKLIHSHIDNSSPLHGTVTSKADHIDTEERLKYLLEKGVNPNLNYIETGTALHLAIANEGFNNKEAQFIAKILICELSNSKYQFDWNIQDKEGKTVLNLAAKVRSKELIKMILDVKKHGADVDIDKADLKGRTALHIACALGDNDSVKMLIKSGANVNALDVQKRSPLHYAIMREKLVKNILEEIDIDPERDENALRNQLLDVRSQPVEIEQFGKRIPVKANKKEVDSIIPSILQLFKEQTFPSEELRNYDINYTKIQSNLTGKSFIQACLEGHIEVVKTLIINNTNLNQPNVNGNTPLSIINRDCRDFSGTTKLDRQVARQIKEYIEANTLDQSFTNQLNIDKSNNKYAVALK